MSRKILGLVGLYFFVRKEAAGRCISKIPELTEFCIVGSRADILELSRPMPSCLHFYKN